MEQQFPLLCPLVGLLGDTEHRSGENSKGEDSGGLGGVSIDPIR
jgi:hypothetical protein